MHHSIALIFFSIISIAASASDELSVRISFNPERFQGWSRISHPGELSKLPAEITVHMLNFFDSKTQLHMRRVCRVFCKAAKITCMKDIYLDLETEIISYKSQKPFTRPFFMLKFTTTRFKDKKTLIIDGLLTNGMELDAYIYINNINPSGFMLFIQKINPQKKLKLHNSDIRDEGTRLLANELKVNKTLTILNLTSNYIGPEGIWPLADSLKVNKTLTELDLFNNYIGPEGAQSLADALKANTTLKRLDLSSNKIGNEGVLPLADALKINNILTELELGHNNIRDEGAQLLADSLKVNNTLKELDLRHNNIHDKDTRLLLANVLKTNKTCVMHY